MKIKRLYEEVNKSFIPPKTSQEEIDALTKLRHYPPGGVILIKEFDIATKIAKFFGYSSSVTVYKD